MCGSCWKNGILKLATKFPLCQLLNRVCAREGLCVCINIKYSMLRVHTEYTQMDQCWMRGSKTIFIHMFYLNCLSSFSLSLSLSPIFSFRSLLLLVFWHVASFDFHLWWFLLKISEEFSLWIYFKANFSVMFNSTHTYCVLHRDRKVKNHKREKRTARREKKSNQKSKLRLHSSKRQFQYAE